MKENNFVFNQIHIEAARNASDDFNLFHDKHKWLQIMHNPFRGPIVLGFQLNMFIEYQIRLHRELNQENKIIEENRLRYSNYQITFVNALRPEHLFSLEIKKTLIKTIPNLTLGNRVSIKSDDKMVMLGFTKETQKPQFLPGFDLSKLPELDKLPDRSYVPETPYFLKRKYLNNGNAKNFISGSLAEQSVYIDELENMHHYPLIFPCSLTSGALLEKAQMENHDFKSNPMVYTSHELSVDRECLSQLKNDDRLHILVDQLPESKEHTLNNTGIMLRVYECYGLVKNQQVLFRIRLSLAPLEEILNGLSKKRS